VVESSYTVDSALEMTTASWRDCIGFKVGEGTLFSFLVIGLLLAEYMGRRSDGIMTAKNICFRQSHVWSKAFDRATRASLTDCGMRPLRGLLTQPMYSYKSRHLACRRMKSARSGTNSNGNRVRVISIHTIAIRKFRSFNPDMLSSKSIEPPLQRIQVFKFLGRICLS